MVTTVRVPHLGPQGKVCRVVTHFAPMNRGQSVAPFEKTGVVMPGAMVCRRQAMIVSRLPIVAWLRQTTAPGTPVVFQVLAFGSRYPSRWMSSTSSSTDSVPR